MNPCATAQLLMSVLWGIYFAVMLKYLWSSSTAEIHLPCPFQLINTRIQPGR